MSNSCFNLEAAIATWGRFLRSAHAISQDDADELESHLRDEIDALVHQGVAEEAAFERAVRQVGDYALLERSYRRVYWKKVRSEHRVTDELRWRLAMLTNYLKIALRNLRREKGYTFINVFGLAVGLACGLLILLFVRDELHYDRFHERADHIYRLTRLSGTADASSNVASSAAAIGPTIQQTLPGVEAVVRWLPIRSDVTLRIDDDTFRSNRLAFVDPTVFDVFTFPLKQGDPQTALQEPNTLVLTEDMARAYFGQADPIGQVITVTFNDGVTRSNTSVDFTVTGVLHNIPRPSHLQFGLMASMSSLLERSYLFDGLGAWFNNLFHTYLLLQEDTDATALETHFPDLVDQYMGEQLRESNFSVALHLQPLTAIHLDSDVSSNLEPGGNIQYVYIFSMIAAFILLIACINFMNLSTARSAHRAREVGMRKVLGARRVQLIKQFIGESMLLTVIALLLAGGLVVASLPFFNDLTGKALTLADLNSASFWAITVCGIIVVGILAGSYPAFFLSAFKPLKTLKASMSAGAQGSTPLRKTLVVFQFALSILLIIGTGVITNQLRYIQHKDLGFDKEQVVILPMKDPGLRERYTTLKQALLQQPNVASVTAAYGIPSQRLAADRWPFYPEGKGDEDWMMETTMVDYDYLETLGMEVTAGRAFSRTIPTDASSAFILNETAVRALGWTNPIGKELAWEYGLGPEQRRHGQVIGVVKDYHYASLHEPIKPLVLLIEPRWFKTLAVRIRGEDVPQTLAGIEQTWHAFDSENEFTYSFLDEDFAQQHEAAYRLGEIVSYFSVLAILIACLGLFGLAAYATERRTKEIGVRKVLGASVAGIVVLVSKDFLKLVGLAFIVATPVAYFAMTRWLEDFAYHISLSWQVFLLAGLVVLLIALMTVSYQSVKAALTDPVKSLRYE